VTEDRKSGKIGEAAAVLGVVLSLVFVGYEIRQNTQLSKAAALQGQAELGAEIALSWIEDDEVIRLLTKILSGALRPEFNEHENAKIRLMYIALFRSAEIRYRLKTLDILDDTSVLGGSAAALRAPYLAATWDTLKVALSPDFVDQFESDYGLR
jgi:hypothetical protein